MLRWTRSRDHKYDFDIFQFKDYLGVACSVHANCIKFCLKLINMSLGRVCIWWSKWNSIPRGDLRFSKNLENHYFLLVEKSQIGGNFQQFTSLCAIISQLLKAKIQSQLLIPIIEILSKGTFTLPSKYFWFSLFSPTRLKWSQTEKSDKVLNVVNFLSLGFPTKGESPGKTVRRNGMRDKRPG